MIDISQIHFHDTGIIKVIEDPQTDLLIMEVDYPVNWERNEFEKRKLVFRDFFNYQIHEIPFKGAPTILDAVILGEENGWMQLKLETNAGYREVFCKGVELVV